MNFGVLVETITLADGKVIKNYEIMKFIDSFKTMNWSLEKLVYILPEEIVLEYLLLSFLTYPQQN